MQSYISLLFVTLILLAPGCGPSKPTPPAGGPAPPPAPAKPPLSKAEKAKRPLPERAREKVNETLENIDANQQRAIDIAAMSLF